MLKDRTIKKWRLICISLKTASIVFLIAAFIGHPGDSFIEGALYFTLAVISLSISLVYDRKIKRAKGIMP
jgi:hypothetical protein